MNKTISFLIVFSGCFSAAFSQSVKMVYDKTSPQENYAVERLEKVLTSKGYAIGNTNKGIIMSLSINAKQLEEEAYSIRADNKKITVTGGSKRGTIYGC